MAVEQLSPDNACERCGGCAHFSYPPQSLSSKSPRVLIVTEEPIVQNDINVRYLLNLLHINGVHQDDVGLASAVRCTGLGENEKEKTAKAHSQYCCALLRADIERLKPECVVTLGTLALKAVQPNAGFKKFLQRITKCSTRGNTIGHEYWHVHSPKLEDVEREPEKKILDQDRQFAKIAQVLAGQYPKHPARGRHYHAARSWEQVQYWMARYNDSEIMAFDIETGGTDSEYNLAVGHMPWHRESYIIGCSIAAFNDEAVFIRFAELTQEQIQTLIAWIKTKKLVMHNGTFDCKFIWVKYGVNLFPALFFDTMLADHLVRSFDKRHSLKFVTGLYFPDFEGYDDPLDDWFSKFNIAKDKRDYALLPEEMLNLYAAMDADVTLKLHFVQDEGLKNLGKHDLLHKHVMPMQDAYGEMEYFGWGFDTEANETLRLEAITERDEVIRRLGDTEVLHRWSMITEASLRASGKMFFDERTQQVFTDRQCLELVGDNKYQRKNGARVKKWTYTLEDLVPDPTKDNIKRQIFFDTNFFGLTPSRLTKKTKVPKVDKKTLLEIKTAAESNRYQDSPIVLATTVALAELEVVVKRISTYLNPAFPHVSKQNKQQLGWLSHDGLIHPDYMLAGREGGGQFDEGGTNSGRISSGNPNMTNMPTRKGGKKLKRQFRPAARDCTGRLITDPEEWYFVQGDYGQLELRVLADRSGDPFMVNAYAAGEDLHTKLASQQQERTVEWFTERLKNDDHPEHDMAFNFRLSAKTSWFAMIYGSGPGNLVDIMVDAGVYLTIGEASDLINRLTASLPHVATLKREVMRSAPTITTLFRRSRTVMNAQSTDREIMAKAHRQLFNFLIQSTGSDIASAGIYAVARWLRNERSERGLRSYPVGTVHDSYIIASPVSEVDYVAWNVRRLMETPRIPWTPVVPIVVDVEVGPTWGDLRGWNYEAR